MERPCTVSGTEVPITVSMGVAVGSGVDGPDASSLRQGGTEAMLEGLAKYLA